MDVADFRKICVAGLDEESLVLVVNSGLSLLEALNQDLKARLSFERSVLFDIKDNLITPEHNGAEVDVIAGNDVHGALSYGLTKYLREDGQHPKRTFRLPGVVFCNARIISIVEQLNEVKSLIQLVVCKSVLHERARIKFFSRRICSGVVLKELYRQVTVFNSRVQSVSFTWAKNVPQSIIVSKEVFLDFLTDQMDGATKQSVSLLQSEIDIVRSLPDSGQLKRVRKIPPHPRCNVVHQEVEGGEFKRVLRHAHLPILINSEKTAFDSCVVRPLLDIDVLNRKLKRPDNMVGFDKIINRWDLYFKG